jgi:hypothetical protein
MRRLVLEFPVGELGTADRVDEGIYRHLKSIEMLHLLKQSREEYVAICRIEFRDPSDRPTMSHLKSKSITEVQLLDEGGDGSITVCLRGRPLSWLVEDLAPVSASSGVYMHGLFELSDGRLKAAYLGTARQMRKFLRGLDEAHIKHKILSLEDARFSADSPLYALTEKQRRILVSAFQLGYFEIPRRVNFGELSQNLNLSRTTINEHLRKAESRLITRILNG